MDPTNPRWQTPDQRWHRNATFWKIIAGATAASAFTAVAVASCLDRDESARRSHELGEPGYVETTAGVPAPATSLVVIVNDHAGEQPAAAPTTTADSTGGAALNGRTETTGAVTGTAGSDTSTGAPNGNGNGANAANNPTTGTVTIINGTPRGNYSPRPVRPVPFETVTPPPNATAPVAGHAAHADNDAANRQAPVQPMTTAGPGGTPVAPGTAQSQGSNPDTPSMQGGAGRFITEAPYWSSSAMTANPDAGAGRFDTERNTPAR